ncbi:hypothetical protein ZIOFF_064039 [Zingiber officinale]|uniref:Homeobox protein LUMINIDEPENDENS n=1 Tax=Zingiber officinale TaxID=94328 RepID=A0A8J5CF92_ZINOF|nr:hypothetical protein ZIOFF_064039 [Zingiber officinale]
MQSVFSIKDTIGKKETREISALCKVTVSQVREFFAGQRSRVRKLVRLSCDQSAKLEASKVSKEECSSSLDHSSSVSEVQLENTAVGTTIGELKQAPENTCILATLKTDQQVTVNPNEPVKVEAGHPSVLPEETAPGVDSDDKEFLDKIFNMMKKEQTFSGQVKLMEWILRINNTAILNWFSNNGGVPILAAWLSEAAVEEQTTVLHVILKVLYHLPLHKALPLHMSAIVPAVNRLRFYRTSDISNRARFLLSRWSKVFIKSQALKIPPISSSKLSLKEIVHKKRMGGCLEDEFLQSNLDNPVDILALAGDNEIHRGLNNTAVFIQCRTREHNKMLKLLPASSSDSSKKQDRSVSSNYELALLTAQLAESKQRRKILLVEQLDHKASGRIAHTVRTASTNHSRPMSADDIQKAKMRAMFMQHKYGKTDPLSCGSQSQKIDYTKESSLATDIISTQKTSQDELVKKEESSIPSISSTSPLNEPETSISHTNSTTIEDCLGILRCKLIQWKIPQGAETCISSSWRVGVGESSKEIDVQTQRNRRENETFYSCFQDIPLNPKEPWDVEMDFDDSLTPEIPLEQPPDADVEEGSSSPSPNNVLEEFPGGGGGAVPPEISSAPSNSDGTPEPDLELLAVLLKNPDLVFALTSTQGKNLTSEEMVALLDMLKRNGVGLNGILNELERQKQTNSYQTQSQKTELPTSLPSPTPPSEAERSGWRSDFPTFTRTPVLQPHFSVNRAVPANAMQTDVVLQHHLFVAAAPVLTQSQASSLAQPAQAPAAILSLPKVAAVANNLATQNGPSASLLASRATAPSPSQRQFQSIAHSSQPATLLDSDMSSNDYSVTNTTFMSSLPRQEPFRHIPSTNSMNPTLPMVPLNAHRSQSTPNDQLIFSRTTPTWPAPGPTAIVRRDLTPNHPTERRNGVFEVPLASQQYYPNQNSYDDYPSRSLPFSGGRAEQNGFINNESETWRSHDSSERPPESSSRWSYGEESKGDSRLNKRPEWSRQGPGSHRDRDTGGSRRWRDRDYSYSHGRRR